MYGAIRRHKEQTYKEKLKRDASHFLGGAILVGIDENGEKRYFINSNDNVRKTYVERHPHIPKKSGQKSFSKYMKKTAAKRIRQQSKVQAYQFNGVDREEVDYSTVCADGAAYKKVYDRWYEVDWLV